MYCRYCGKELPDDDAAFCPYCGQKAKQEAGEPFADYANKGDGSAYGGHSSSAGPNPTPPPYARPRPDDAPNAGWAVLGFFFPIVGLILYLVWQAEYPNRAKMCGKGALISVIVSFGFALLMVVFALIIASVAGVQYYGIAIGTILI